MKKIVGIIIMVLLLVGCTSQSGSSKEAEPEEETPQTGILTLKINPEVELKYDMEGLVLSLNGMNEEGKAITAAYSDYIGKDVYVVLKELIETIHAEGYLKEDETGDQKDITLELEPGSVLPSENFFGKASKEMKEVVAKLTQSENTDHKIPLNQAKALAIQISNNDEESILTVKERFDEKDNLYHFEFLTDSLVEILQLDARTGRTVKHHIEAIEKEMVSSNETENTKKTPQVNPIGKVPVNTQSKTEESNNPTVETKSEPKQETKQSSKKESKPVIKEETTPQTKQETKAESKKEPETTKPKKEKSELMSLNEAKAIALKHAGLSGQSVTYNDAELDYDDGVPVYEIEFDHGGFEYEVEVHGITGKILDYEKED